MLRAALLISLALGSAGIASAGPRILEHLTGSYELVLGEVRMPRGDAGTVSVKPCETCQWKLHRVTSSTEYLFDGERFPLEEFLEVVTALRQSRDGNEDVLAGVIYDLKSTRVTRIALYDHRQ